MLVRFALSGFPSLFCCSALPPSSALLMEKAKRADCDQEDHTSFPPQSPLRAATTFDRNGGGGEDDEKFESGKLYRTNDVLFSIKLSVHSIQQYQCAVPIQLAPFQIEKKQWMDFIDALCDIFKAVFGENGERFRESAGYLSSLFCRTPKESLLEDEDIYNELLQLVRKTSDKLEKNGIYLVIQKNTDSILVVKINHQ